VLLSALVLVAALALPVSAWLVEAVSATAENWILPLQVLIVLGLAAAAGWSQSRPEGRGRAVVAWLAAGVLAILVVDGVWWLLLAG
jgi:hypothetical protein